jgi:hypothetical protein
MQPKIYISYSREKSGEVFAFFYFESHADIYGWHIEAKGQYLSAAFFMIENFYAENATHLYRSIQDDVFGPWTIDYPPTKDEVIRCPVPEALSHELESLQSRFVEEWLIFRDDPHRSADIVALESHGLPVQDINISLRKLSRMDKSRPLWTYATPGVDRNVVDLLRKYWRLNEKIPAS